QVDGVTTERAGRRCFQEGGGTSAIDRYQRRSAINVDRETSVLGRPGVPNLYRVDFVVRHEGMQSRSRKTVNEASTLCSGGFGLMDRQAGSAEPVVKVVKIAGSGTDVVVTPHARPAAVWNEIGQLRGPRQLLGVGAKFVVGRALPRHR